MKNKTILLLLLIVIIFLFISYDNTINGLHNKFINKIEEKKLNTHLLNNIKSGNLSTDYTIDQALYDIENLNLNTINIPVVINIDNLYTNTFSIDESSKQRAIELLKILNNKKFNDMKISTILEPYPWISNGSEYETNYNPTDINTFFLNWKNNVLKILIDQIAIPYEVDALNVGTSFNNIESAEGYWCDTIDFVKQYYKGLITYRTSWWITAEWDKKTLNNYEKKLNNKLFSKLDFISIAAYFELTNNDTNTVENLVSSLESTQIYDRKQNVIKELKNFYDKPIFFGELGFPKTTKASIHPWNPFESTILNGTEQANCFEAYKLTFENEPWILGFSIFAIGENSTDKMYYPSIESVEVIKNWYKN